MSDTPIIIKKIKKHGEGHHGGAWKVAYADFVTAMMALFIVLWVMGQDQNIKESIAHYFKDPLGISDKGKGLMQGSTLKPDKPIASNPQTFQEMEIEKLKAMGDRILAELSSDSSFVFMIDKIKVEITKEGLRIEMLESNGDIFFQVGTAVLNNKAKEMIIKIGNQLAKLPNNIVLEGHTDSRPFNNGKSGYTNFELSSDRANAARSALTLSQLNESQIVEIRGYADRHLRDPENPYSLVNRRISIIVKYLEKK
ncbi:MAG: flagellar motor protein MotB [Ignavibacteriaceae bacterium]